MLCKLCGAQAAQRFGAAVRGGHIKPAQAEHIVCAGLFIGFKILRGVQII